jgi:HD superfamily phosphohydrolase
MDFFTPKELGMIKDPLYTYIIFNKRTERPIIDSPFFQRLRYLHQLQVAHLVYPGATHSRFQHSLGAMHLAGLFSEFILLSNKEGTQNTQEIYELVQIARIAGLLHDIGHGPYSHAFDEGVSMPNKELKAKGINNHEVVGRCLIEHSEIGEHLENLGYLDKVLQLLSDDSKSIPPELRPLRLTVKEWVYPVDIIDFLMRDSYYCGVQEYGHVDYMRLLRSTGICNIEHLCIMKKALSSLKAFLISRFSMFENVYYHKTTRLLDWIIRESLRHASEELGLPDILLAMMDGDFERWLALTEQSVLSEILRASAVSNVSPDIKKAGKYARMFRERRIPWKLVAEKELKFYGSQALVLSRFFREDSLREDMCEMIIEGLPGDVKTIAEKDDALFIDHSKHKWLPDNPYEQKGFIYVRASYDAEPEKQMLMREFLEEHPYFARKFRIYAHKELIQKCPDIAKRAKNAIEEVFSSGEREGVTM